MECLGLLDPEMPPLLQSIHLRHLHVQDDKESVAAEFFLMPALR